MTKTAYQRAEALRLAEQETAQRAMSPLKVGQKVLREWLGRQGFGALIDPMAGAELVRRIEAAIVAERAPIVDDDGNIIASGDPCFSVDKRPGWKSRPCPKCGVARTEKGHDPCISDLPGVAYACCGHGQHLGYIAFENGVLIRGEFEETKLPSARRDRKERV